MDNIQKKEQNIFGDIMTITLIRAIIIYIFITISIRVMGKRQVGELNPQELVITILISAVATVPLEDNGMPLANSLIPIAIFISFEIINSALSMKSLWFRNLVQGKPVFLIKDGKIQQKELNRLRYTVDDLIDSVRQEGEFDISKVQNAIVETNGKLSVQSNDKGNDVPITLIMDGKPIKEYYSSITYTESEIKLMAVANGVQIQNIFLMNVASDGTAYIVEKEKK